MNTWPMGSISASQDNLDSYLDDLDSYLDLQKIINQHVW